MAGTKIREFLKIMEGELIPTKSHTLRVELDPYSLYRLLLRMPSPQNYIQPDGNGTMGVLTFMDPVSYAEAKGKFDKFGIKYKEDEGMNNLWDNERKYDDTFAVSPYPGNNAEGNNTVKWDNSSTVKKKPMIKQGPTGKAKKAT